MYYDFSIWVSDKIINTLEADPNAIFSTDYSGITANPLLISGTEDQNRTASVVIKECLSLGDIDSNRYLFGFYNGRRAVYSAIPTDTEYHYYRYSKNQTIETVEGQTVYPWDVMPGKWVFIPDLLSGTSARTDRKTDPRMLFVENVSFSAPASVTLQGSQVLNMPQLMARLGLGL